MTKQQRAEARRFRELAAHHRGCIAYLRALPIGSRDPIRVLEHRTRLNEYTLAASQRDREARLIREGRAT